MTLCTDGHNTRMIKHVYCINTIGDHQSYIIFTISIVNTTLVT